MGTYPRLLLEMLRFVALWLLKGYSEDIRDPKQRHFNKELCRARVVTENAYGMLKGRFRILYQKTECQVKNLKYVLCCTIFVSL